VGVLYFMHPGVVDHTSLGHYRDGSVRPPKTRKTSVASLPIQRYRLPKVLRPRETGLAHKSTDFHSLAMLGIDCVRSPTRSHCSNVLRNITNLVVRQYTSSATSVNELPIRAPFSTEEKPPR
jgi:hypothetical protein